MIKHYITIKAIKVAMFFCYYGDTYDYLVEALKFEEGY